MQTRAAPRCLRGCGTAQPLRPRSLVRGPHPVYEPATRLHQEELEAHRATKSKKKEVVKAKEVVVLGPTVQGHEKDIEAKVAEVPGFQCTKAKTPASKNKPKPWRSDRAQWETDTKDLRKWYAEAGPEAESSDSRDSPLSQENEHKAGEVQAAQGPSKPGYYRSDGCSECVDGCVCSNIKRGQALSTWFWS